MTFYGDYTLRALGLLCAACGLETTISGDDWLALLWREGELVGYCSID